MHLPMVRSHYKIMLKKTILKKFELEDNLIIPKDVYPSMRPRL